MEGLDGVTAIEVSEAAETARTVVPVIEPDVAWIVDEPTPTPLARPAVEIVAMLVVSEDQLTELVMFCVVPSLYLPVAVNWSVSPFAMVGFAGVTAIDEREGPVTVSVVEAVTEPETAWIVDEPAAMAVARPSEEIVATDGVSDDQVTELVRFWVLPSLKVPLAVNCCVVFLASVGLAGVTTIDFRVAAATVKVIEPTTLPEVAVMTLVPADFAVTSPAPLTVATAGF
jgi:hypothetical protein